METQLLFLLTPLSYKGGIPSIRQVVGSHLEHELEITFSEGLGRARHLSSFLHRHDSLFTAAAPLVDGSGSALFNSSHSNWFRQDLSRYWTVKPSTVMNAPV